jgi:NAD(P)-dependent dehydrogenase (short-subunit alcohol dehydrogenase family)
MRQSNKTKVAVVTGAGKGIGRATAAAFLEAGWRVVIAEQERALGERTARTLGRNASFVLTDVSDEASVRALADAARKIGRLDALINNAGVSEFRPLADTTLEHWNRVIGINLTGAFLCARELAPLLRRSRGAIVNISSTRALMSERDTFPYSATKGGLVALTHALAVSLGPDVRVNCVSPGWIDTTGAKLRKVDHAQHPAGRVGKPDDIAAAVLYLCSAEAGFITGANLVVDGGMTRKMIYAE